MTRRATKGLTSFQAMVRILLELSLLGAYAFWGWRLGGDRPIQVVLAIALPTAAAIVWGLFGTPGDPGRGDGVVKVPGRVRLMLEFALFVIAAYGVWTSGSRAAAETLLTAYGLHLAVTYDRVLWLFRH
jgi:hypothetical protein